MTKGRIADEVASHLVQMGVTRVFILPGGPISPVVDALMDVDIDVVSCLHETMGVYMAMGHSRGTGELGVLMVTSGPGILNAIHGITAAYEDSDSLLVLVGEVTTEARGQGALQDGGEHGIQLSQLLAPITRWTGSAARPEQVLPRVHEAIAAATETPRGPAVLRLPVDVTSAPMTKQQHVVIEPRERKLTVATERAAAEIAKKLVSANRPVVLLGGALKEKNCALPLARFLERADVVVATDLEGKGVVSEHEGSLAGIFGVGGDGRAAKTLKRADVVVAIGTRFDDTTTANFSPIVADGGWLAHVTDRPTHLGRAYHADLSVAAELPEFLDTLSAALPAGRAIVRESQVVRTVQHRADLGEAPHDPRSVIAWAQREFPEAVFVSDIGNHLLFTAMETRLGPGRFHASIGLGGMGSGLGIAMGLQLAYGDTKKVVAVVGDGTLMMHGSELATCAKYSIPLTVIALNDGQFGMVEHGCERVYQRSHEWSLPSGSLDRWIEEVAPGVDVRVFVCDPTVTAANARDLTIVSENEAVDELAERRAKHGS